MTEKTNANAEIYAAIAALQAEGLAVERSATGQVGQQSYKYATLGTILALIHEHLGKKGIAFTQAVSVAPSSHYTPESPLCVVRVISRLTKGEQSFETTTSLPVMGGRIGEATLAPTPQESGSAITYAKKYAALSLIGLAQDDDDGAAASGSAPPARARSQSQPQQQRQQQPKVTEDGVRIGKWMPSSREGDPPNTWHATIADGAEGEEVEIRTSKGDRKRVVLTENLGKTGYGKNEEWDWDEVPKEQPPKPQPTDEVPF